MQHRLWAEVRSTSYQPWPGAPPRACRESQATQAAQQSGTPPRARLGRLCKVLGSVILSCWSPPPLCKKGESPGRGRPKTGQGRRPTPNRGPPSLARRNSWGCQPAFPVYSVLLTEVGCHAAISPGRPWSQAGTLRRDGFCAALYVPDFLCVEARSTINTRREEPTAWLHGPPRVRQRCGIHCIARHFAILPFPGLQVPWLPSSEWCRWGCGGRTRSGTARRRLAPGWRTGAGGGRRWN